MEPDASLIYVKVAWPEEDGRPLAIAMLAGFDASALALAAIRATILGAERISCLWQRSAAV